jgi:hypothetical protein
MKFSLAFAVAVTLGAEVSSFQIRPSGKIPTKERVGKESFDTDRRSFVSAALAFGGAGLLSPLQPANAVYLDKDGNKVDRFGRPIPLAEELLARAKANEGKELKPQKKAAAAADPKLIAEAKEKEEKAEQERLEAEKRRLEEEEEKRLALERVPPEAPRVLVLGGSGTVGTAVRSKLEEQGFFVVATSRDGRGNTVELDVTKCYGKIEKEVFQLAKDNKCSAVVSLIGGVGLDNDGLINGATGQAALAASNVPCVRNFVTIGPSASIIEKVPKGLEAYVKSKQLSQEIVMNTFKEDPKKQGMSYTIINPGAIGKSKNYGSDPAVPLETVVNAVVVGATGYYVGESSAVLDNVDDIKSKASKISKVKELKA